MPRISPTSRWVVLPTAVATAALVTAVAWAGSGGKANSDPQQVALVARAPAAAPAAGDPKAPAATTRNQAPAAADRDKRAPVAAPPAANRFHPAPSRTHPRPTPTKPRPTNPGMPSSSDPAPPAPTGGGGAPTTNPGNGSFTAQVVTLTNAERAKVGCGALTVNATLTQVAQAHSVDMGQNNYFDHNSQNGQSPFDRMTAAGYAFSTAAENIAAGQRTPQDVMTSWMNSPGHKANILNCALHEIGVGYASVSGSQYGAYWTQDFGTPR